MVAFVRIEVACSNDVQVALLRLLQLPLDDQVMPAASSCEVASAWVRNVAARAGPEKPSAIRVAAPAAPSMTTRLTDGTSDVILMS